jgi:quinone-modifying oxidoreductase subunit QmoB
LTEEEKEDEDNFDRVQMMAEDYIKMGMAGWRRSICPSPTAGEPSKKILVIGGGITGMSAAMDAAKAGYPVTIVEKLPSWAVMRPNWRSQLPVETLRSADSAGGGCQDRRSGGHAQHHRQNRDRGGPDCRPAR